MKHVVGMMVATCASLLAVDAGAMELGTRATQRPYRSAQHFALELRFSPYRPQVDDDPKLTGRPFESAFGTTPRLFVGLELDWQTFRIPHVGTIGPGLGVGYVGMSQTVRTVVTDRQSGDETSLAIYPMWAVAVLRADALWRDFGFPIVPYGKAGFGMAFWRASNTGVTSSEGNVSGKGHTLGTNFALGAAFALDALDRGASRNFDTATGVNNSYVYVEAYWLSLQGTNALRVGTNTWAAGLAFEF